jgi:hypothetical protein
MNLKKLPIGIQAFAEIIQNDYLYVDKTEQIYRLISGGGKYFFLSRPRRFGKSLLVSTLKEIFRGRQELFQGLWIENKLDWTTFNHPIIFIDFTQINYEQPELLKQGLLGQLHDCARQYGIDASNITDYKVGLGYLIRQLAYQGKVVILIDEYDKPIIDYIDNPTMAAKNREILRNFYGIFKALDEQLRFVLLTGVSKFSKVSVFSGLNNLNDITIDKSYASICGYTHDELQHYFMEYIDIFIAKKGLKKKKALKIIRTWYNGYSWDGQTFVYNPFSILNLFDKFSIQNYWFSSGTPTFLITLISAQQTAVAEFENLVVGDTVLESFDIERIGLEALLFQTGYLTIKQRYDMDGSARYQMSYPNREVRESFINHLLQYLSQQPFSRLTALADSLTAQLNSNHLSVFMEEITAIFSDIPYDLSKNQNEGYFHSLFYLTLRLLGASISCEIETNRGRIDAILETKNHIYIIEFKMGKAADALTQIKNQGYFEKYKTQKKPVTLVGIGFDRQNRNIGDWSFENR